MVPQIISPLPPTSTPKYFAPILLITALVSLILGFFLGKFAAVSKPQTSPPPISIPTVTPDSTTNWKIYQNQRYGFEFKYPPEAKFEKLGTGPHQQYKVTFIGPKQIASGRVEAELADGYIFYVSNRGIEPASNIDKVTTETYTGAKLDCYELSQFSPITSTFVDGRAAKTYDVQNCLGDYTEIFVSNGKNVFEITQIYVGEPTDQKKYRETTNQILSTFKFLGQDQTSSWKTYRNNTYNFELKYPNDWTSQSPSPSYARLMGTDLSMTIADSNSEFMNECMKEIKSESLTLANASFIKRYFQEINFGEMCNNPNPQNWQIWLIPQNTRFNFGFIFFYKQNNQTQSEILFDQILSTFKFID